ncbi:hypothetical protein JD844_018633 [Phrynosoma platyrhinos]|uniref:Src-like-adapter 2 n=1 Tax=Phrynosoma platyrhinos TaxID=52577 RepID=A0ABQ7SNW1_PHRPL|nr:hypothetical protein JD844_018633 [Phrynosoma platyrhinos]
MGIFPSRRREITAEPSPQNNQSLNPSLAVTPPGANISIAIAVCNFPSGDAEPILRMGEQLKLLSEEGEWWKVKSVVTGKDCCIPSNQVAKISHRWLYEGISRAKAEELLLLPYNHEGSFLVRESQVRKETRDGLCCCLKEPCFIQGSTSDLLHNLSKPVVVSKPALNWQEINSSDLLAEGPLPEDFPISLGLREAVTSYLLMTEDLPLDDTLGMKKSRNT